MSYSVLVDVDGPGAGDVRRVDVEGVGILRFRGGESVVAGSLLALRLCGDEGWTRAGALEYVGGASLMTWSCFTSK